VSLNGVEWGIHLWNLANGYCRKIGASREQARREGGDDGTVNGYGRSADYDDDEMDV
jgi:hypothetical protein